MGNLRASALVASGTRIKVRLVAIEYAARDISTYAFSRADGESLPEASPGSHIDLHLPSGQVRQYSLIRLEQIPTKYTIAVKLDRNGRGGSRSIHEDLRVGSTIEIGLPRNNFPLAEEAEHSIFIAGGIGITPIFAMIKHLHKLGRSWELHYACRSRADAAFLPEFPDCKAIYLHIDDENEGQFIDIRTILGRASHKAHLYCCGPAPMMTGFEEHTKHWPKSHVHVEYFAPRETADRSGGYVVELARSGQMFLVPAGKTILEVLREAALDLPSSCEQGICGACETRVVEGMPDHHDSILTEQERLAGKTMMICCSGSKTERLVLDL